MYFLVYCGWTRNRPALYNQAILPAFVSGAMWAVADACWLSEGYRGCREPHLLTRFLNESTPALRATLKKLHDVDEQFEDLELLPTHCPEVFARYGPEEDPA